MDFNESHSYRTTKSLALCSQFKHFFLLQLFNWYIYIYEYIYDVFCHRIPLELEEKEEHNGFKLPDVTVMRFMFNVEFPWAPRGSRTTLVAPEAAAGETTKS